jgi:hypothetical protein
MDLDELKQTWAEHTVKLDRLLELNLQAIRSAQVDRSRSALNRYRKHLVIELITGVVFAGMLGVYLAHRLTVPSLAIPALILEAFAIAAIAGCVRQLIRLHQISFEDPVTIIQAKLEAVKLHMLETSRLMVLSLPFYFAYIVLGFDLRFGVDILTQGDRAYIYANLALSLAFVFPAFWVFRNLNFRNAGHPVIRVFIYGAGRKEVLAATDFLSRIEHFRAEE